MEESVDREAIWKEYGLSLTQKRASSQVDTQRGFLDYWCRLRLLYCSILQCGWLRTCFDARALVDQGWLSHNTEVGSKLCPRWRTNPTPNYLGPYLASQCWILWWGMFICYWMESWKSQQNLTNSTANVERGWFTWLSVEVDLSKPLLPKFLLHCRVWRIQYEGLRLICFKCGKVGHKEEHCPLCPTEVQDEVPKETKSYIDPTTITPNPRPENTEDFGSWMLVKKPQRKHQPKPGTNGKSESKAWDSNNRVGSHGFKIYGVSSSGTGLANLESGKTGAN